MRLLRLIWKDMLWLNSLHPVMRIVGLVFGIVLIVGAWYLGSEWWSRPMLFKGGYRPRAGVVSGALIMIFMVYVGHVIDRYRKSG